MGLTSSERQQAEKQRFQAIELRREGLSNAEIASRLGVTPKTVWSWFSNEHLDGLHLASRKSSGRPSKVKADKETILVALRNGPKASGIQQDNWTIEQVINLVARVTGVRYSESTARSLLQESGYQPILTPSILVGRQVRTDSKLSGEEAVLPDARGRPDRVPSLGELSGEIVRKHQLQNFWEALLQMEHNLDDFPDDANKLDFLVDLYIPTFIIIEQLDRASAAVTETLQKLPLIRREYSMPINRWVRVLGLLFEYRGWIQGTRGYYGASVQSYAQADRLYKRYNHFERRIEPAHWYGRFGVEALTPTIFPHNHAHTLGVRVASVLSADEIQLYLRVAAKEHNQRSMTMNAKYDEAGLAMAQWLVGKNTNNLYMDCFTYFDDHKIRTHTTFAKLDKIQRDLSDGGNYSNAIGEILLELESAGKIEHPSLIAAAFTLVASYSYLDKQINRSEIPLTVIADQCEVVKRSCPYQEHFRYQMANAMQLRALEQMTPKERMVYRSELEARVADKSNRWLYWLTDLHQSELVGC